MRIGVVTTSYPREAGDPAGSFVAGFARWMQRTGAEIEVIAAGPGGPLVDGIPVERVGGSGLFYAGGAPDALDGPLAWIRALRFTAELTARVALRLPRWDAVVSHWVAPAGLAVATVQLAQRRQQPHLAVAHSSDVALLQRSKAGRAALRALALRSDLVYSAEHLVVDGAPGRVMAMGVDVADVGAGDRARGRRRFGMVRPTVLFLGRLVPVKGVDLLLQALPPGVDLVVAGDGPLSSYLRRVAADTKVAARFVGEVRGRDRADLLAGADLMVVPSRVLPDGRTEGAPTVMFEALAAGLPLVATRCTGIGRLLTDGVDALVVEPDATSIRSAIERLAGDALLRAQLSVCGRVQAALRDWSQVGPLLAGTLGEQMTRAGCSLAPRAAQRNAARSA